MDSTWTESEQRGSQAETAEWLSLQVGLGSQEVEIVFFCGMAEYGGMGVWRFNKKRFKRFAASWCQVFRKPEKKEKVKEPSQNIFFLVQVLKPLLAAWFHDGFELLWSTWVRRNHVGSDEHYVGSLNNPRGVDDFPIEMPFQFLLHLEVLER